MIGLVIAAGIFMTVQVKYYDVKTAVFLQYEEMQIKSIHQIGGWGEWFKEYVLVVEKDRVTYRMWTDEDGKVVDSEVFKGGS
ncbi:hypothetical protein JMA_04230 [Jeotgalibacillus malaysiensis]|uniref:Uncharacterized protein n=1 Tax=Jeotgalibacillus malaysiensis TaxID=1508404 RepID=A0A0B5AH66_9BACL|nr:hypothetical protein JMA_04230 [Jeotgalibacillus malaysiensis]